MGSLRSLIETLKWLDFHDVLSCSSVSVLYHKAATADELWLDLCERHAIDLLVCAGLTAFSAFRASILSVSALFLFFPSRYFCFRCKDESWRTGEIANIHIGWNTSWVVIKDVVVISGGGSPKTNQAWIYSESLGGVREIAPMRRIREGHGLAYHSGRVFAFGGANAGSTCEKYQNDVWTSMDNMLTSHSWFTPAVHHLAIYLCGGSTDRCEKFSTTTEMCSPLNFVLPEATEACAFRNGDKLVIVQRNVASEVEGGKIVREVHRKSWGSSWTNMSPLVAGGYVYLPRQLDRCVRRLSLLSLKEVEVIKIL